MTGARRVVPRGSARDSNSRAWERVPSRTDRKVREAREETLDGTFVANGQGVRAAGQSRLVPGFRVVPGPLGGRKG